MDVSLFTLSLIYIYIYHKSVLFYSKMHIINWQAPHIIRNNLIIIYRGYSEIDRIHLKNI